MVASPVRTGAEGRPDRARGDHVRSSRCAQRARNGASAHRGPPGASPRPIGVNMPKNITPSTIGLTTRFSTSASFIQARFAGASQSGLASVTTSVSADSPKPKDRPSRRATTNRRRAARTPRRTACRTSDWRVEAFLSWILGTWDDLRAILTVRQHEARRDHFNRSGWRTFWRWRAGLKLCPRSAAARWINYVDDLWRTQTPCQARHCRVIIGKRCQDGNPRHRTEVVDEPLRQLGCRRGIRCP